MAIDNNDKILVRTIIAKAHNLDLELIAEGVENEEQRQFLMDHGCDKFQGYLFG
jgi:EAL domain-containing protein (putative c-di-GMP-specific phosphodiesterase class I)